MGQELKEIIQFIKEYSSVGTAIAAIVAVFQYISAMKWKKAEFIANEMGIFFNPQKNPLVNDVLKILDWENRDFKLVSNTKTIVTDTLLADSFSWDPQKSYTDEQVAIRDRFDDFFGYLVEFDNYLQLKLIKTKHLRPYLEYYLKILVKQDDKLERKYLPQLWQFVNMYYKTPVYDLLKRFELFIPIEFQQMR